jgi:hypothetical protein
MSTETIPIHLATAQEARAPETARSYRQESLASLSNTALGRDVLISADPNTLQGPGFTIHRLEENQRVAMGADDILATKAERLQVIEESLYDGTNRLVDEGAELRQDEKLFSAFGVVKVDKADYEAMVRDGRVQPAPDGQIPYSFMSSAEATETGLAAETVAQRDEVFHGILEDFLKEHPQDFDIPEQDVAANVEKLKEAYELEVFGETRKIFNFSDHALSDDELAAICNATRAMAQNTGGDIMNRLVSISILPGHGEGKSSDEPNYWGTYWGTTSAKNTYDKTSQEPKGSILLNADLLEGESRNIVTRSGTTISSQGQSRADGLELRLVHELMHTNTLKDTNPSAPHSKEVGPFGKDVGWQPGTSAAIPYVYAGKEQHPSEYAASDPFEDESESAAALHAGGELGDKVDDTRKRALEKRWADTHSGVQGPAYVQCRQIDLAALRASGGKIGMQQQWRNIAVEAPIYYQVQ